MTEFTQEQPPDRAVTCLQDLIPVIQDPTHRILQHTVLAGAATIHIDLQLQQEARQVQLVEVLALPAEVPEVHQEALEAQEDAEEDKI